MESDTTPEARAILTAWYRSMTPEQRLELGLQMAEEGRLMHLRAIKDRHPAYSDEEAQLALGRLWLGDELFRKVRPDAPLLDP